MDIELCNVGSAGSMTDYTVVVDAYYVTVRKDVASNNYQNVQQAFTSAVSEVALIPTGNTMLATTAGVSPFDAPSFCEKFVITKKQRLVLSPGQVSSFVVKNSKPRKYESSDIYLTTLHRGQRGILFVWSGVVSTSAAVIPPTEVAFSVNRSYHYIINQSNIEAGAQHP